MIVTDPIADMLTRIRNANVARHESVDIPYSVIKAEMADILFEEGYIKNREIVEDGKYKNIRVWLKYDVNKQRVKSGLKRISKPGLRVYTNHNDLPKVLGGLGTAIISTAKGVLTDKQARKEGIGGEVLCYIW